MPQLYDDPNAATGDVISANNAPNGTNLMVSFEFSFQCVANNVGNTSLTITESDTASTTPGILVLGWTASGGELSPDPLVDPSAPQTQAAFIYTYDFAIDTPSAYSSVTNPSETFTTTITNNTFPDDPPLTYTFTVHVTNQPPHNTPPTAAPVFVKILGDLVVLNQFAGTFGSDTDHDTVSVDKVTVEDAFTITSAPELLSTKFTKDAVGLTFEGGANELNADITLGIPTAYMNIPLYDGLSNNEAAIFRVDYTVDDGHTAQNAVANPGQTASNVCTLEFVGGHLAGSAIEATQSAASGGLQLPSLVDQMEALAVGYLGGPTDLATISSWAGQMLLSGLTLSQLAASIATESAVTAEYPFLANPQSATPTQVASFVNSVYENVFERAPTATELTTAENTLTTNLSNSQTVDTFILNLMLGAQGQDQTTVTNLIGGAEGILVIEQAYLAITRTPVSVSQATTTANGIIAGAQSETQFINGLLSQVADTTIPAVAVEGSMYGQVGSSAEITNLVTNYLPTQIANAVQNGNNPLVSACEALGLMFAFGDENGGTGFATNFGPSNSAMPATAAGDAAFAAAAASAIFGSAATANTPGEILTFVTNWETSYTQNGIPGNPTPTAAQIDLAARGTAWGDAVAIAFANNLGPIVGQTTNFLEDAAQGTAIYSASLSSQPTAAPPPPTISSISAATDTGAPTINAGHLVTITMTTSEAVTVTGTPTLQLNDNEVAAYTFGSGTNTLSFSYVAQTGDNVADLHVTGLNLPTGASILDGNGNSLAGSVTSDLGIQVDTVTVPLTSVQQQVLGLYGVLYTRAADFGGLSYWTGVVGQQPDGAGVTVANGASTAITINDATVLGQLFVSTESSYFNQVYGAMSDSTFITTLYGTIGGNTIGIAPGITYWSGVMQAAETAGQSQQAARAGIVGEIVQAMIDYNINIRPAGYTDAEWLAAQQRQETTDNKVAVSLAYSNASQQPGGTILDAVTVTDAAFQAATRVIEGVTYNGTTADAAISNILHAVALQDLTQIQPVGVVSGGLMG